MKNKKIKTGKLQMKAILLAGVLVFESVFAGIGPVNAQTVSENGITAEENVSPDASVSENAPEQEVIPETKMSGPQDEQVLSEKAVIKYSGRDGEVNWSIDVNGHLTLTGNGDYIGNNVREPKWLEYSSEIISAEVAVTNMTRTNCMFRGCTSLTSLDLSNFDTGKVTRMSYMFDDCESLVGIPFGPKFDTSNVTNMSGMFYGCESLTSLDLSNFDTSKVTDMYHMFYGCESLTSVDLGNFETGNVTDMGSMFDGCKQLTSLDLTNFDTSNVTNMSYMFYYCEGLTSLDLGNFDTSNVTNMSYMFYYCESLTSLDLSNFDTSKVTDMSCMFYACESLTSLDVSDFDTSNVTSMHWMFYDCESLTSLDLSDFDTSNVTGMNYMFRACRRLTNLTLGLKFNTSNVTSMVAMFEGCASFTSLDLSNFNTGKVTSMERMLYGCGMIEELDLSTWNLGALTNAKSMLYDMNKLAKITLPNLPLNIDFSRTYYDNENVKTDTARANRGIVTYILIPYADSYCGKNGHNYDTPLFVWNTDYKKVRVHFICKNQGCQYYNKITVPAVITTQTIQPTTETEGAISYTATVVFQGKTYTETKSISIPKLPSTQTPQSQKPSGTTMNTAGIFYRVIKTGNSPELAYMGPKNKKVKTVTIPATVKIDGVTYKVTSVADGALKNYKNLTKVTIGKNVTKIGKNAFYGCKKLKTIVIKSKKIKSVGKNALKGIKKNATIDVPGSKEKAYKKLLKSKTGYQKTMRVK